MFSSALNEHRGFRGGFKEKHVKASYEQAEQCAQMQDGIPLDYLTQHNVLKVKDMISEWQIISLMDKIAMQSGSLFIWYT